MHDSTRSDRQHGLGTRHVAGAVGTVAIHLALFAVLLRPIHAAPIAEHKPAKPAPPELVVSCDFPTTAPSSLRADPATAMSSQRLRVRDQALLDVRIARDGTPVDVRVLSGTGDGYLDQLALCSTLRRSYAPPRGLAALGEARLIVPVAFPSERR